jgi:Tfp pilus assembly protein PilV
VNEARLGDVLGFLVCYLQLIFEAKETSSVEMKMEETRDEMKMEEIGQTYSQGTTDPDATLVQPRFDESEAQTAQRVVPLARGASWQRRRLPVALVLISALIGGLVSVVAYRVYQRTPQATRSAATRATELTASAPANEDAAPAKSKADAAPRTTSQTVAATDEAAPESKNESASRNESEARASAPERSDETSARGEPTAARASRKGDDERAARDERRRESDERASRENPPRARRVDVIPAYPDNYRIERDKHRDNNEATDYQLPSDRRDERRGRRAKRRNIDRIRDIFGAPPPA